MNAILELEPKALTSFVQASSPPADAPIPTTHNSVALAPSCCTGKAGVLRGGLAAFGRLEGILGPFSCAPGFAAIGASPA